MSLWPWLAVQVSQISMHPEAVWPSNTNMASGASYIYMASDINRDPSCTGQWTQTWPWPQLISYDAMTSTGAHVTHVCMALSMLQPPDTNPTTAGSPDPGHLCDLWWQSGPWTSIQTQACSRTTDPDMVLGSSLDTDVIMALAGITGHPDEHGPSGSVAIKCEHDPLPPSGI